MTSPFARPRRACAPFSFQGGVERSSSRDPLPLDTRNHAREGCANTDGGKTKRCSPVPLERDDPAACMRSPDTKRCVARPKPRACEFNEAPNNKSPRCRIATNGEHDERCYLKKTGQCALVESRRSPVGRKRPASVAKRPGIGLRPPVPPVVVPPPAPVGIRATRDCGGCYVCMHDGMGACSDLRRR